MDESSVLPVVVVASIAFHQLILLEIVEPIVTLGAQSAAYFLLEDDDGGHAFN